MEWEGSNKSLAKSFKDSLKMANSMESQLIRAQMGKSTQETIVMEN